MEMEELNMVSFFPFPRWGQGSGDSGVVVVDFPPAHHIESGLGSETGRAGVAVETDRMEPGVTRRMGLGDWREEPDLEDGGGRGRRRLLFFALAGLSALCAIINPCMPAFLPACLVPSMPLP